MIPTIKAAPYGQLPPYTTHEDIVPARDFVNLHNFGIVDESAAVTPEAQFIPGNTEALQRFTSSLDEIFRTIQSVIGPIPARILGTNLLAILGWNFVETSALLFEGRNVHLQDHLSEESIEQVKQLIAATPHEFTLFFNISSAPKDVLPLLRNVLSSTCSEEIISEETCQNLAASFQDISLATQEHEYLERYSTLAYKPREFLEAFKEQPDEFAFILTREFEGKPQTIRLLFGTVCPDFVVTACALEVIHGTSSVLVYNEIAADWYVDTMLGYVRMRSLGPNREEVIYNQIKLGMDARGGALHTFDSGILQDDVTTWHAFLHLSTKNSCADVLLIAQIAHEIGAPREKIDSFIKHAKPRDATNALWPLALSFLQDGTLTFCQWQHVMQCLAMASDNARYINTLTKPYLLLRSGEYTLRFDVEPIQAFGTFSDVFTKLSGHKNLGPLVEALIASRKRRLEPSPILTKALNLQALDLNYFACLIVNSCSKELHPALLQQFIPTMKNCSERLQPVLLQLMEVVLLQHGYPLDAKERLLLQDSELFEFHWVHILQKCQNTTCTRIGFELACAKVSQLVDELQVLQLELLSLNVTTQNSLKKDHHLALLHKWFHLLPDTGLEPQKTGFLLLDFCRREDGHEARNCRVVDKILRNYNAKDYPAFNFLKFCYSYGTLNLPTMPRLITELSALQDPKVDYILITYFCNSQSVEARNALLEVANRVIKDPHNPAFQKAKTFLNPYVK